MKKEKQSQSALTNREKKDKKLLNSHEAAEYLGIDYCNFRKQRNKGYFGRDRYPAPPFINFGISEHGFLYRVSDLDEWLENFPSYTSVALHFKETADFDESENYSYER